MSCVRVFDYFFCFVLGLDVTLLECAFNAVSESGAPLVRARAIEAGLPATPPNASKHSLSTLARARRELSLTLALVNF